MAALGAIGYRRSVEGEAKLATRTLAGALRRNGGAGVQPSTSVSGHTLVSSILTGLHRVYAYDRATGKLLKNTKSNSAGAWTIRGLTSATSAYCFMTFAEATDTGSFNAARADQVTQP